MLEARDDASSSTNPIKDTKCLQILLIDDDESFLSIARYYLSEINPSLEITGVNNPIKALDQLNNNHFDAVVSDYQMPDMSGLELLQKLRSRGDDVAFVILTGKSREEVAIKALNLGADFYLQKNNLGEHLFKELAHHLSTAVNRRNMAQQLRQSEQEKRMILDSLQEILVYQNSEGLINWANQAAARSVDRSPEEMVDHYCFELWHNRSDRCPGCPVKTALETNAYAEGEIQTPDGNIWLITGNPIFNELGEQIGAVETSLNLTVLQKRLKQSKFT